MDASCDHSLTDISQTPKSCLLPFCQRIDHDCLLAQNFYTRGHACLSTYTLISINTPQMASM